MNLIQYRTELRLDLNDSGALWSDTELTRCVQRSVDDLSRFLPLEQVYELTFEYDVDDESFTTPATASPTAIVNAITLSGETDGATLSIADTTPDVPRRLTLTLTDANFSITELTMTVKGYDQDGFYIEESWYLASLVSGIAKQGNLYFSRITGVIVTHIGGSAGAGDTISVGTGNAYDSFIFLANKPLKPEKETVTNAAGTTTYTRDTDYYMDYANGAIKFINGGGMAAGTAYLIDYDKSRIGIDIGAILPIVTRIHKVYYPADLIPQQSVAFNIIGNFMYIGSKRAGESQEQLTSGEHITIHYERKQMPPGEGSVGSYPNVLDEVICIGAGAYALMIKAVQYEHQSVTDMASARTALGNISAIHTLTNTALGKVSTYVTDMDTALNKVTASVTDMNTALDNVTTYVSDMNTALDAAIVQIAASATALAKVDTYLAGASESSKAILAQIATDIAGLRTAFNTAVDAANAALDNIAFSDVGSHLTSAGTALAKVLTYLENNTNEDSKSWLTKITTDIAGLRTAILTAVDACNSYLDEVDTTDLGQATVGAEGLLETGDNKIDQVNIGDRVSEIYREYSGARVAIAGARISAALGYVRETDSRLSNLRSYIEQAAGWGAIATGFINEATQRLSTAAIVINRERAQVEQAAGYVTEAMARLNNLRGYIEQALGYGSIATGFVAEADSRIAAANAYMNEAIGRSSMTQAFISEANGRFSMAQSYINEAGGRFNMVQSFISEAAGRMAEIDRHVAEAMQYTTIAGVDLTLSDRFRTESTERRNEFWAILRDKSEYRKRISSTPVRQPA